MMEAERAPDGVDLSRPSPARLYDYYLGGTNNFQVDRDAAAAIMRAVPELRDIAWANRGFHQRSARWIAERGVRQFIDAGAGLPTVGNTHEVVQRVIPDACVAYLDDDPTVLECSESLMTLNANTRVIKADIRHPDDVLNDPELQGLIDFTQPVGLLIVAVLHFVTDEVDPWYVLACYMDALASGSYLSLSHITADKNPPQAVKAFLDVYANATQSGCFLSREEVERFFAGLELVPPYEGARPSLCCAGQWARKILRWRTAKDRGGSGAESPAVPERSRRSAGADRSTFRSGASAAKSRRPGG